jgi:hypothetical protein
MVAELTANGEIAVAETIELTTAHRQLNRLVEQFKLS